MTLRQFPAVNPICPVSLFSLAHAFLPFFNMTFWWSLSVSCESNHTPSHPAAPLLKATSVPPVLIVAVGAFLLRLKGIASLLLWSKVTPFLSLHLHATSAAFKNIVTAQGQAGSR